MSARSKSTPASKRIVIVDDHPMMRQGLALLIQNEPGLTLCGEAESAEQALTVITKQKPDLVLADISLPGKNGIELIKDLHSLRPELPVLIISMHDEAIYAERVLRAGGRGYIMKQEGGQKLMQAIRQVLGGQIYVSEKMAVRIIDIFSGQRAEKTSSPVEKLTDREFEIFQLIGQGRSTKDIAASLHISAKTVEVHRLNMKEKLQVRTAAELIHYAVRWVESQTT